MKDTGINDLKNEKGMLSVEMILVLTTVFLFYLTILNVGRLCFAEVLIQQSLNNTAIQISQYSYVLDKTGVIKAVNNTHKNAEDMENDINVMTEGIKSVYSTVSGNDFSSISASNINDIINVSGDAKSVYNTASKYFKDPKGLVTGLLAIAKEKVEEKAFSYLVGAIARAQVEGYLEDYLSKSEDDKPDVDAYLENLGIVDGLDGLDFSDSTFIAKGTQDIYVTVKFKYKSKYAIFDFGERQVMLNACTRAW